MITAILWAIMALIAMGIVLLIFVAIPIAVLVFAIIGFITVIRFLTRRVRRKQGYVI